MTSPYGWWLPYDASTHGPQIDNLINLLHWFMLLLFVGWGIYLVYVLVAFRQRPGHKADGSPKHFRLPTWLEVGVALFEVCLLAFVASPIWFRYRNQAPDVKEAELIRVVAQQFNWNFHYPGRDGKFGRTKPDLVDESNPLGLDRKDPAGRDDITTINNMHIPVGKPILVYLTSKDVIHSFGIPVLRVKQDAIPGMTIPVWFEAKETGSQFDPKPNDDDKLLPDGNIQDNPNKFEISCAQLCGLGHYNMKARLYIQTKEEYAAFLAAAEKELLESQEGEAAPAEPAAAPEATPAPAAEPTTGGEGT